MTQDGNCQQCGGKGCVACDAREQEPVAWWNGKGSVVFMHEEISTPNWTDYYNIPLYTRPPKREWVGLTDDERDELMDNYDVALPDYAKAIEAKLKEKNT